VRLSGHRSLAALAIAGLVAVLAAGCGREHEPDLVNGKAMFVQKCSSCHALNRANSQGTRGPNLDESFDVALREGMNEATVAGVVKRQIANVRRGSEMPANLVTGNDATDVAAYVASVIGKQGQDGGALAQAGLAGATTGEAIFRGAGCGSCHALADAGASGGIGPDLDEALAGQDADAIRTSIVEPNAEIADGFSAGVMPPNYGETLSQAELDALVEYLGSVTQG
jgi:mono/diheme cytochrome c family protein